MVKNIAKILVFLLLFVIVVLVSAYFLIQKENVQNWLVQKFTKTFSEKLQTKVEIKHIKIDFLNHLNLQGVLVEDEKKDTLLYAGNVQLKITDWFFLQKETPVVSYIGLQDAYINMYRNTKSERWNYDFISEKLASKNTTTDTITNNNSKDTSTNNFTIDVKQIALENIRFHYIDKWYGVNYVVDLGKLDVDANAIDIPKKIINLAKIDIEKPTIVYQDYVGGMPEDTTTTPRDTSMFNPDFWKINIANLKLADGKFNYDKNAEKSTPNVFDEDHIAVHNLNLQFNNTAIQGDTITSNIKTLSAIDRCGFVLNNLAGNVKLSSVSARLDDLLLQTPNSTIGNYYEMVYSNFTDFRDYIDKVVMKANFTNAIISFKDIAYFTPQIKNIPVNNVTIKTGKAFGTVANIATNDINLQLGNSLLIGNLSLKGLPDIDKTFITLESKNLQTSGQEILHYIPQLKTDAVAWNKLNSINFKGKYQGYIYDFVTDGTLTTSLGNVSTNIHMTLPKNDNSQPTYEGKIVTTNFQLGNLIQQNVVGNITLNAFVKGSGFDFEHLNTSIDGKVQSIQTQNYTYKDIVVNGTISNKKFIGKINANDPSIAMNFDGALDLSQKNPDFKLKTKLVRFDLKALGITDDPIKGSAFMDLNLTGNTLDNFTGIAKLYNVHLENEAKKIYLDSAILSSTPIGNNKKIILKSSVADAQLTGDFTIAQLPKAIQLYLSNYLPAYKHKPTNVSNQQFDFTLQTKNIEPLLKTFLKKIGGCNNAYFNGSLNMFSKNLILNGSIPNFTYRNIALQNIDLKNIGNFNSLNLDATIGNFSIDSSTIIPATFVKATIGNDSANFTLRTDGGSYNVKNALIEGKGYAQNGNLYLNILPSSFYLKENKWNISSQNYIAFTNNKIELEKLIIENGFQKIALNTEGNNYENLVANIENIDLHDLIKMANNNTDKPNNNELYGRINGKIIVNNFLTNRALSGNLTTDEIRMGADTLGKLIANVDYNDSTKTITVNHNSGIEYKNTSSEIYGTVNVKDEDPILDLHAKLNNTPVKTVENFIGEFISNTKGNLNGFIDLQGKLSQYNINGEVAVNDLSTKINYLGTVYTIPYGKVTISNTEINLGNISIYDDRNNPAILSGNITHNRLKDFEFHTRINSNKKPFHFLNTKEKDNSLYYGTVMASGAISIYGTLQDMGMDIIATTTTGTHLYLPIKSSFDNNEYEFIQFKKYDQLSEDNNGKEKGEENKLKIGLYIRATPDAEMSIIMDQNTGEEIYGVGNGDINMNIDLNNSVTMSGKYTIEKGKYFYNFRGLLKKDLDIEQGGVIEWNGDPLTAQLNLKATYSPKTNLSLKPLLNARDQAGASSSDISAAAQQYKTLVSISLKGEMLKPDIQYDIQQPDNTDITSLQYKKLVEIQNNEDQKLKQLGGLLLLDQFIPDEQNANSQYTGALLNGANDVLSPTLSGVISKTLNKVLGTDDLNINLNYKNNNGLNSLNTDQLKFSVSKSLFNKRILVELGNSLDYVKNTSTTTSKTNFNFLDEFKLQYLINKNGKFRLNFFRSTYNDFTSSTTSDFVKNGVGIMYKRNFNSINDMFFARKKEEPNILDTTQTQNGTQ